MLTLTQQKDPVARLSLIACALLVCYVALSSMTAPAQAQAPVILIATPTLPLPTEAPALVQAAPTMAPEQIAAQAPPIVIEPTPDVIYAEAPPPIVIESTPEIIYAEPPAPIVIESPPIIIVQTAASEIQQPLPGGGAIVLATPGPGDPGFADSFGAPDPTAHCQFVGCL